MKVQELDTPQGVKYILLNNNYDDIPVVHKYLKAKDAAGCSPNTLQTYAFALLHFYTYLQECKSSDPITLFSDPETNVVDVLAEYMLWLQYPDYASGVITMGGEQPKRSNKTVNQYIVIATDFLRYLIENNDIINNPVLETKISVAKFPSFLSQMYKAGIQKYKNTLKLPVTPKPVQWVTRAQYEQLLKACNTRRDRLLVAIVYECGLRIDEALGLHISDVRDIDKRIIHIVARDDNANRARVKDYDVGDVVYPPYVGEMLTEYLYTDLADIDTDYLFVNLERGVIGSPMTYSNARKSIMRAAKKTGIDVHWHMLRHGFAMEKREDFSLPEVQVMLRHKTASSTLIYATPTDEMRCNMMNQYIEGKNEEAYNEYITEQVIGKSVEKPKT